MVDGKKSRKKTKSIKYCAPKCHNVGPLTEMMAKQRDQKCCRTIANDLVILLRGWIAFLFNQHINFGAQMSPITLKLLLTSMTVVTVASKEGRSIFFSCLCWILNPKGVSGRDHKGKVILGYFVESWILPYYLGYQYGYLVDFLIPVLSNSTSI